jgi:hypothetical protein
METKFRKSLAIGQVWESTMVQWMYKYFSDTTWEVEDARDVHRDEDGDQFPDFILYDTNSGKICFIDAKKRNAYYMYGERYFGFDERLYNSYKNIAKKHDTKVYVGFNDPKFDPDHVYILDMDLPHSRKLFFNNEHGTGHAYRWNIDILTKFKI